MKMELSFSQTASLKTAIGWRTCAEVMRWVLCHLLLLLLLTLVLRPSPVFAREIFDMAGRRVTVTDSILSVYGSSPPATYMMYAMAPKLIAGLNFAIDSDQKKYLPTGLGELPVVGGWFGQGQSPNLETLLAVTPDIALGWVYNGSAMMEKIEETLTPLGIPLVKIRLDTMADYPEAFRFLGILLGTEARGKALADDISRLVLSVEIPIGILTSLVGIPFFALILRNARKGWR